MFDFFTLLFGRKRHDPIDAEVAEAADRHCRAANGLIGLLCDIQLHGPIVEKHDAKIEPTFKLN